MTPSIRASGADAPDPAAGEPRPRPRGRTTQEMLADRRGPGLATTLLRTVLAVAVVVAVLAVVWFGAAALEPNDNERAPWAAKSAPDVRPAPLGPQ